MPRIVSGRWRGAAREAQTRGETTARSVEELECAMVACDHRLDDREAEPASASFVTTRPLQPLERLHDARALRSRNTGATVGDINHDLLLGGRHGCVHRTGV